MFIILTFPSPVMADLEIEWEITYGTSEDEGIRHIVQSKDGGLVLIGSKSVENHDWWTDALVMKTDATGNQIWNKTFNGVYGEGFVQPTAIVETTENDIWIAGNSDISPHNVSAWLYKLNSRGGTTWQKYFNDPEAKLCNRLGDMVITPQEELVIVISSGECLNDEFSETNLIKMSQTGEIFWNTSISGGHIFPTSDGGYLIGGNIGNLTNSDALDNIIVFKVDASGNLLWNNTYGISYRYNFLQSLVEIDNNHYAVVFGSYPPNSFLFFNVMKFSNNGDIIWDKQIGTHGLKEIDGGGMIKTTDGGLLLSGCYVSNTKDGMLMKLTGEGEIQWEYKLGGDSDDDVKSVIEINPDQFILGGYTESSGAGRGDMWLMKTKPISTNPTVLSKTDNANFAAFNFFTTFIIFVYVLNIHRSRRK